MTYINPYFAKNKGRLLEFKNPNRHNWIKYNWESSLTDFDLNTLSKNAICIKNIATSNLDDIEWDKALRFHLISLCLVEAIDIFRDTKKLYSWLRYIDNNCDLRLAGELCSEGNKWLRNSTLFLCDKKCVYCDIRLRNGWHLDHVIPRSKGGTLNPSNVVAACPGCNRAKGTKSLEDFIALQTNQRYNKIKALLHIKNLQPKMSFRFPPSSQVNQCQ